MINKYSLSVLFVLSFFTLQLSAKKPVLDSEVIPKAPLPVERFYFGNGFDGLIFSTAFIRRTETLYNPGGGYTTATNHSTGTLRFSCILNFGFTFHYNFGDHLGAYTGIGIKNVGFIEHFNDGVIVKHRTYNIGVPLALKIGNMENKRTYVYLGGGIDAAVNYKEKTFAIRHSKEKFDEWFSDATPTFMPYFFAGVTIRGVTAKVQYYPNNFLNPDFIRNNTKPFAGTDVHLLFVSLGLMFHYNTVCQEMKIKQANELNEM